MTMSPRLLGTTGLTVTQLGLGLAALGRPGYINLGHAADLAQDYDVAAMEARAHATLDAAWAAGVRCFDVARSYGRAEDFLGRWLAARRIPARRGDRRLEMGPAQAAIKTWSLQPHRITSQAIDLRR
jgi:aryl-alcohol dehydrogenase-like predicted oxidoreductase